MTSVQLLEKTEVWLHGIDLDNANLPGLADVVAEVLSLPRDKVFVTDVRPQLVVLDILAPRVELEHVAGKQSDLLAALAAVPGIHVAADATVHSEGILGVIGTPGKTWTAIWPMRASWKARSPPMLRAELR